MSKLSVTSKRFKLGLKIFFLAAFVYYVGILFIIPRSQELIKKLIPDKNPPTVAFGKLPRLRFDPKELTGNQPSITLNTKTGKLPNNLPDRLRVYKFIEPEFSYFARQKAEENANFLGFSDTELSTDLKANIYIWRSLQSGGILKINIDNRVLTLETELFGNGQKYISGSLRKTDATNVAVRLFQSLGRFNDADYVNGEKKVFLGKYLGNALIQTANDREAQLARVDLYRSINNYPILGPDSEKGLLHAIVSNPSRMGNPYNYPIIEAYYWEIQKESGATYPVIDVNTAWNSVKSGKGIISSVVPKEKNPFEAYSPVRIDNVRIDNIYLAYYETPEFQKYLQPIYVFEGNYSARGTEGGEIKIYFPAVSGDYIE